MKKNTFYMLALAAIAAAAISCEREQSPAGEDIPAGSEFVFTASTDQARSKTTVENGEGTERIVKWAAGDEISVYWDGGNTTATAGAAGTSTTFTPSGTPSADMYYAAYPSSVATAFSDGALTVKIPATQDGSFANANIAVAKTTDLERDFQFTNLTALVKFTVSGSYTKAVFRGAKGETLAGTVPVNMSGAPVLGEVSSPAKEIEVTLNGAGDYYISVLPVTLEGGFSISLYEDTTTEPAAFLPIEVDLARGTITNLGTVDGRSITNYFAKPGGAGKKNGKNWENALDADKLRTVLQQQGAVLDGVTVYMAEGDYYLAGEAGGAVTMSYPDYPTQVNVTFLGGYPDNLTGTSTAGRDTTAYRSAFTGNDDAGILVIGSQTNMTFEGVTFKNASRESNGGALLAGADTGNCTLVLSSCRFIENTNTDANTGAGIYLKKASATIDHCYFGWNHARNGSGINLDSGEGTVTISNCLFKKNSTFNTSGALQNGSAKTVTVTDCTFDSNSAGSYGGGAFHTNGTGAKTTFTDCTFSNNTAAQGGAVSIQVGEATFTDCTFTGNSATNGSKKAAGDADNDVLAAQAGGVIILHHAQAVCNLNNCTFTNNTAPNGNGGAIASENVAATLNINAGTTFTNCTSFGPGGAIFVRKVKLNIKGTSASKVTFSGNKTLATGNQHANGGAIWLGPSSTSNLSYAKFDSCEAGQEDGSTVNYSNGGAISMRSITSFLMDNCEFSGNRGRNGGCLNLDLGTSSVCKVTNCNFHDNIGRSGANKNGTSGNFSGAVARLGGGEVEFEDCIFKDNVVNNASAVLHMNVENAVAHFTDCILTGNECRSNNVCIKMEKAGEKLYMNRCLFEGNHGNSRGMINPANNTLLYMNDVTFKDNYTTASNGWGVAIHAGTAHICMNNVTSFNNKNTNPNPGSSASFNADGGWLIVNSTIIDSTPYGIVRQGGSNASKVTLCNNVLINRNPAKNVVVFNNKSNFADYGHNVFSYPAAPDGSDINGDGKSPYHPGSLASTDVISQTEATLGGSYSAQWSSKPYYGVYAWSNNLSGFTAATSAQVEDAMKTGFPMTDAKVTLDNGGADMGNDFYNWLNSIGALGKDARGETRGTPWWPGAYQQN
jgi:hypothetical protein